MKKVFLGYPFAIPEIRTAVEAGCSGIANVIVASDRLRGKHLLVKIDEMIREADLSLFDFTLHNPNVAVEFGIAYTLRRKWAILYSMHPEHQVDSLNASRIFSDLQGMDSICYPDFDTLAGELKRLLPEYLEAAHVGLNPAASTVGLDIAGNHVEALTKPADRASAEGQRRHEQSLMPIVSVRLDCTGKRGALVPEVAIRGVAVNSGLGPATSVYLHLATVSYMPTHAINLPEIAPSAEHPINLDFQLSPTAQQLDRVPYTCVTRFSDIFGNEGAIAQQSYSGLRKDMTTIGRILPAPNTAVQIEKLLNDNHVPKGIVQ
jgi:hypothetical protein